MSSMGLLTVIIVVSTGEAKDFFVNKKFTIKPVIGGFILGVFLFALEAWNDELATRIDTLIIIGALLVNGQSITTALNKG